MTQQIMNFKKMEVVGATKEEALALAPFKANRDATQAYRKWREGMTKGITESDIKEFMLDYMTKKGAYEGYGFYITLESAVADSRQRPYTIEDVTNKKGARSWETIYSICDDETGVELASTADTKAVAKDLAKKLYTEENFRGNLTCNKVKRVKEGEAVAFRVKYTPSVNAKPGRYLVFGIEC